MEENFPDGVEVRMGPFRWTLGVGHDEHWQLVEQDEAKHYVYTSNTHALILINRHVTEDMRRVVVLHELMHAAFFSGGGLFNKKLVEEDWVQRVAPMLLDSLQSSDPDLVRWICRMEPVG